MGGAFCKNLSAYTNACEMSRCVQRIQGLASNSVSPTDTWIIHFKPGVHYEMAPIKTTFTKVFVSFDQGSVAN